MHCMHYFNITDAGYAFLTPPPPGAYVINGRPHTLWTAPKWTGMLGEDDENVAHPASPLACANEFCKIIFVGATHLGKFLKLPKT